MGLKLVVVLLSVILAVDSINNCPMTTTKTIIQRAVDAAGADAALQMQLIRRIHEDVFGGTWGVLIIKNIDLVSNSVHWTIPDHRNEDGSPAFCLSTEGQWQYNVFKTGNVDINNRLTVEQVVGQIQRKQKPERFISEFDQRIATALLKKRQNKLAISGINN